MEKLGDNAVSYSCADTTEHHRMFKVCLGPESNRHGVSPKGFSYSLQLSLLHAIAMHL
jgi:hypothetical protein